MILLPLSHTVLGEFDTGEDVGVVLAGGNPGAVTTTVDETLD